MRHFPTRSKAHYGATAAHTVFPKSVEASMLEIRKRQTDRLTDPVWRRRRSTIYDVESLSLRD